MPITIQVNSKGQTRQLDALVEKLSGPRRQALMQDLGKGLEHDLQEHFLRKNETPNKRGFPRSNFWAEVRRSTQLASATAQRATVTISDPRFATHLRGATIRPRNSKYLAIPNTAEASGSEPRSGRIVGLFFAKNKKGTRMLATKAEAAGGITVHYWLKESVRIPKDPQALPNQRTLGELTLARATAHLFRMGEG